MLTVKRLIKINKYKTNIHSLKYLTSNHIQCCLTANHLPVVGF